jgi:hypothetical protein
VVEYNTSDKLAIALACLGGVVTIILFLIEKTPVTILSLLLGMLALSIYPVLHFTKRVAWRVLALIACVISVSGLGIGVWPTKLDQTKASLRAVGDTSYRNLVAEVIQSLDPKAHIAVGNAIEGPDGFRKVDVEVRARDGKLIAVDVIDRPDNRKVGVESIDQADSKRADIKANAMVVCSNTGFDEIAIRKAKRVGIGLIAIVKQGDQRARAVIQEEIYLRKADITPLTITFDGVTQADGQLLHRYVGTADDVKYQGGPAARWLQQQAAAFVTLHPAVQDTCIATFHLRDPTEFSVQGHPVILKALRIQFQCRPRWFSQVVELDAKSAVYDYIRGRFVFTPGPNAFTIKGINFDTATPMASPPAVNDVDFGLRTDRVQLGQIGWGIPNDAGGTIPNLGNLVEPVDLSCGATGVPPQGNPSHSS